MQRESESEWSGFRRGVRRTSAERAGAPSDLEAIAEELEAEREARAALEQRLAALTRRVQPLLAQWRAMPSGGEANPFSEELRTAAQHPREEPAQSLRTRLERIEVQLDLLRAVRAEANAPRDAEAVERLTQMLDNETAARKALTERVELLARELMAGKERAPHPARDTRSALIETLARRLDDERAAREDVATRTGQLEEAIKGLREMLSHEQRERETLRAMIAGALKELGEARRPGPVGTEPSTGGAAESEKEPAREAEGTSKASKPLKPEILDKYEEEELTDSLFRFLQSP